MTLLNRALETRIVKDLGWQKWAAGGSSPMMASPTHVTPESSMQLLAVYGSVQLISQQISTLPVKVYTRDGDTRSLVAPPPWLRFPNEGCPTPIDLLTQVTVSLLLDGNAYLVPYFDRSMRPTEVYVLDPTKVRVERIAGQIVYKIDGRQIPGRVLHIRGLIMPGELKGLSPIEAARLSISSGLAAAEQARAQFDNGTVAPGVIEYPGAMTETQRKDQAQAWDESQSGKGRNRPLVLMNGAAWRNISLTPEQAQFLQTRQFTDGQIAGMLFNIDPAELGIAVGAAGKIEYQNVESRGITLSRKTLLPWIKRIEAAFDALLPSSQFVKLSLDGLQRPDLTTRYSAYQTGTTGGWLTIDEVRALEDMSPLGG